MSGTGDHDGRYGHLAYATTSRLMAAVYWRRPRLFRGRSSMRLRSSVTLISFTPGSSPDQAARSRRGAASTYLVSRNFCRDAYVAETALETVPEEPGVRMPKWGSMRSVPLPSDAHAALLAESEASSHRLVFPSLPTSKPLIGGFRSAHSIRWALTRCCRRSGLKPTHMHMLRHTYASHLVMKRVNIKAVQELLGHATLEMTMRYSHLAPDHKAGLVECLAE